MVARAISRFRQRGSGAFGPRDMFCSPAAILLTLKRINDRGEIVLDRPFSGKDHLLYPWLIILRRQFKERLGMGTGRTYLGGFPVPMKIATVAAAPFYYFISLEDLTFL